MRNIIDQNKNVKINFKNLDDKAAIGQFIETRKYDKITKKKYLHITCTRRKTLVSIARKITKLILLFLGLVFHGQH